MTAHGSPVERPLLPRRGSVNGVFKGGGAKGIAYAGALKAVERRGLQFASVAGTSAGAITATLVAAGYSAEQIAEQVPTLLRTLSGRWAAFLGWLRLVLGLQDARYGNARLGDELERLIKTWHPADAPGPTTFADLHASGITLYVVALDLARSTPVVFSAHTTPRVSVTSAVLASSAIPAVFPSARAGGRSGSGVVTHRLVDGGAWANFPRFVFHDDSFRHMLQAQVATDLSEEAARPTLLFALDNSNGPEPFAIDWVDHTSSGPVSFDRGTLQSAKSPALWLFGTYLTSHLLRALLGIALVGMLYGLAIGLRSAFWDFSTLVSRDTSGLSPLAIGFAGTLTALTGVLVAVGVIFFWATSKISGTTLIPAARSAMAVGTGVAPWVGYAPTDYIVRVPFGALETTGFDVGKTPRDCAILAGYVASVSQIAGYQGEVVPDWPGAPSATGESRHSLRYMALPALIMIMPLIASIFLVTSILFQFEIDRTSLVMLAGSLVLTILCLTVAARSAASFHDAISLGASVRLLTGRSGRVVLAALCTVGALALLGGTLLASTMQTEYQAGVRHGLVVEARRALISGTDDTTFVYRVEPDAAADFRGVSDPLLVSDARIPVGQEVDFALRSSGDLVLVDGVQLGLLGPALLQFGGVVAFVLAGWAVQVRRRDRALAPPSPD